MTQMARRYRTLRRAYSDPMDRADLPPQIDDETKRALLAVTRRAALAHR